jgi:hypothetical protein
MILIALRRAPCQRDSVVPQTPGRGIETCRPKAVLVNEVDNLALVQAVSIDEISHLQFSAASSPPSTLEPGVSFLSHG